jgi:hypothetical protein
MILRELFVLTCPEAQGGDGAGSPGTIVASGSGFLVQGSHDYALPGTYTAQVTVAQTGGPSLAITSVVNVIAPALAVTPVELPAMLGTQYTNALVATFTDPNSGATAGTFSAIINWGDGTAPTSGTVVGSAGMFQVLGSHDYASAGLLPLSVEIFRNDPVPVGIGLGMVFAGDAQQPAISGPSVVPSNTAYWYVVTLPKGLKAADLKKQTWSTSDGNVATLDKAYRFTEGDTLVGIAGVFDFKGTKAPGTATLTVTYDIGTGQKKLSFKVDVVQVIVSPLPKPAFRAKASVPTGQQWIFTTKNKNLPLVSQHRPGSAIDQFKTIDNPNYRQPGNTEASLAVSSRTNDDAPSAYAITNQVVTLQVPDKRYDDLRYIQVGYIQTTFGYGGLADYQGNKARVWANYVKNLDAPDWYGSTKGNPMWPWYDPVSGRDANFEEFGGTVLNTGKLTLADSPTNVLPSTYFQEPNSATTLLDLTEIENFTVNLAVALKGQKDADATFYSVATTDWFLDWGYNKGKASAVIGGSIAWALNNRVSYINVNVVPAYYYYRFPYETWDAAP